MKRCRSALALMFGVVFAMGAQAVAVGYNPRTGDIWLDTELNEINRYGRDYGDYFIDDVVLSFGPPRSVVYELYYQRLWQPADIYYACALAYLLQRPCLEVVGVYELDPGQGWGVIAQRLGIKPGSEAFHRLKGRVGASSGKFKVYDQDRNGKSKSAQATSAESGNSKASSASEGPPASSGKDNDSHGNSEKAKDNGHGNDEGQGNGNGHGQEKNNNGKDGK